MAIGAVVLYLVLTVPNDVQAAALMRTARRQIADGENDRARAAPSRIGQQYPRNDAAAAATRVARRLGLKGFIQNNRDGSVDATVEGEKSAIDEWIEELKEGPRYAEVTKIDQETKDFSGKLPDFDVKF